MYTFSLINQINVCIYVMLNLYAYKSVGTLFNYVLQREFFFFYCPRE